MNEKFRERELKDETRKRDFNTWYNIGMPQSMMETALNKLEIDNKISPSKKYEQSQSSWNKFYNYHQSSFFRDRKWLSLEFPQIFDIQKTILDVGCGVGNSLVDIPGKIHACDFSQKAIELAKKRLPDINFFVHDLTSETALDLKVDAVLMVFTLSAIHPRFHEKIFVKLANCLKEGGQIVFKDYGYLDMIQLRYKHDQVVEKNFYQRKDGTYTYFFSIEYLKTLLDKCELTPIQLFEDKKLYINRKRDLEMYRVMIQGVFVKKSAYSEKNK